MNGSRGILIAAVVGLLVGASLGLMGGILFARHMFPMGAPRERHARSGDHEQRLIGYLERRLGLDAAQRDKIEKLLEQAHRDMAASRDSLHARIERELTEEQRKQWQNMEPGVRFPGRNQRGRPGPPPPGERPEPEGGNP